jgi:hypothetical protein
MAQEIENAAGAILGQITEKVEAIKSDARMVEVAQLLKALNTLEGLLQRPATTMAKLFALGGEVAAAEGSFAVDEFVNVTPIDAAKRYLAKVGRPARPLDEIVKMVRSGGGEITNISGLRVGLNRSNEVKAVGDDVYGLSVWYPKRRGRPPGSTNASSSEYDHDEVIEEDEVASMTPGDDVNETSGAGGFKVADMTSAADDPQRDEE